MTTLIKKYGNDTVEPLVDRDDMYDLLMEDLYTSTNIGIRSPVVTIVNRRSDGVPIDPDITTTPFIYVADIHFTHHSTTWNIRDESGTSVWSSIANTTDLLAIKVPYHTLELDTAYVLEVTFNGTGPDGVVPGAMSVTRFRTVKSLLSYSITEQFPLLSGKDLSSSVIIPGNKLLVTGGSLLGVQSDETWILDMNAGVWTQVANLPVPTSYGSISILDNDNLLYVGGSTSGGRVKTCYVYNISGNLWIRVADIPAELQAHYQVTLNDGRVMVMGDSNSVNNAFIYNPSTDTWFVAAPMPINGSYFSACVLNNGNVFVSTLWAGTISNKIQIYNPVTNTWTATILIPPPLNGFHSGTVTLTNGKVLLVGGTNNIVAKSTLATYDPITNEWELLPNMPITVNNVDCHVTDSGKVVFLRLKTGGITGSSLITIN